MGEDSSTNVNEGNDRRNRLTTSFEHLVEDDVTCAVCLDLFEDPVLLSCTHDFCERCAKLLIRKLENGRHIIPCPICRTENELKNATEPLLRNDSLKRRMEKLKQKSKETHHFISPLLLASLEKVEIPRNIKLMEEYDAAIGKGKATYIPDIHTGMIGYGLDEEKENNHSMTYWRAIIIGPQESPIGQLIYNLKIVVPEKYPKEPPKVFFVNPKVSMECVDKLGQVDPAKIPKIDMSLVDQANGQVTEATGELYKWIPLHNIADVLVAVREAMHLEYVCSASSELGSTRYTLKVEEEEEEEEEEDEVA